MKWNFINLHVQDMITYIGVNLSEGKEKSPLTEVTAGMGNCIQQVLWNVITRGYAKHVANEAIIPCKVVKRAHHFSRANKLHIFRQKQ